MQVFPGRASLPGSCNADHEDTAQVVSDPAACASIIQKDEGSCERSVQTELCGLEEQVACLCTVKAYLEETTEHPTLQEVDGAGPGAAKTELSEVNESRPKLEEEVTCPPPANTVKVRITMKDEGACARSVKTEQSGLEDVTCLCTAKANLDETNEHHKSEEDEADEKYRKLEDEVAALRSAQAELRQVSDRYHKLEIIAGLRAATAGKSELLEAKDEVTGRSSETELEIRQLEDEVTGLRESNAVLREAYDTLKAAFQPFREGPELVSAEDMSQPAMQKPRCVAEVQPLREAGLFVDLCPAPTSGPGTLEAVHPPAKTAEVTQARDQCQEEVLACLFAEISKLRQENEELKQNAAAKDIPPLPHQPMDVANSCQREEEPPVAPPPLPSQEPPAAPPPPSEEPPASPPRPPEELPASSPCAAEEPPPSSSPPPPSEEPPLPPQSDPAQAVDTASACGHRQADRERSVLHAAVAQPSDTKDKEDEKDFGQCREVRFFRHQDDRVTSAGSVADSPASADDDGMEAKLTEKNMETTRSPMTDPRAASQACTSKVMPARLPLSDSQQAVPWPSQAACLDQEKVEEAAASPPSASEANAWEPAASPPSCAAASLPPPSEVMPAKLPLSDSQQAAACLDQEKVEEAAASPPSASEANAWEPAASPPSCAAASLPPPSEADGLKEPPLPPPAHPPEEPPLPPPADPPEAKLPERSIETTGSLSADPPTEAKQYDLKDREALARFLVDANIRLVRTEFLQKLHEDKERLPRRQEAESDHLEDLVTDAEVLEWARRDESEVSLIISISHCWEAREHPDPWGYQLSRIVLALEEFWQDRSRETREMSSEEGGETSPKGQAVSPKRPKPWVFLDYMSLFQFVRSSDEEQCYQRAVQGIHTMYAHEHTRTLRIARLTPAEWKHENAKRLKVYFEPEKLSDLLLNELPFLKRGWCFSETQWAASRTATDRSWEVDSAEADPAGDLPMTPEAFEARVKEGGLKFSHAQDAKFVKQLQLQVFRYKAGTKKELKVSSLEEKELETAMQTLQHYTGLETLEITNCKLPVQLPSMLKAIMQTQILALSVDQSSMNDSSACALAKALEENKALKSLSLRKNNIKDGVMALVKAMEFNPELTKLDISENDIGPCALTIFKYAKGRKREVVHRDVAFFIDAEEPGDTEYQKADSLSLLLTSEEHVLRFVEITSALGSPLMRLKLTMQSERCCEVLPAIGKLQQLTSLSLDMKARSIQDAGCIALAEALGQLKQLQSVTLNLRSNSIGDEGCTALAEVLRHSPKLTTMNLHLDDNQINNTGCLVWAVHLREMQHLTSMRVSFRGNKEISGEAWAVWLEAVGNLRWLRNVTLVSLRRRTIEASPKALKGVVGQISQLQQLRSIGLDVADNFVDDLGCTGLADALGKLQSLTTMSLDMSCNCIRDAGFSALSGALRRLKQLKHVTLNLRSNCMGDAGCRDLAKVLGQLPELSSLSLDIGFNTWRKDIALTAWTQTLSQLRDLAFVSLDMEKRSKNRHLLLQREVGKKRWAALYTAFGEALGKLQRLEILHLSLRGAIGSVVGCSGLVKALGSLAQLQKLRSLSLDLERDCLTGQGCDALAKTLGQLQHLTALSLAVAENKIEASGCFALATGLGQLKELTSLRLRCIFSDARSRSRLRLEVRGALKLTARQCTLRNSRRDLSGLTASLPPYCRQD
eukprot:s2054_g5.t4